MPAGGYANTVPLVYNTSTHVPEGHTIHRLAQRRQARTESSPLRHRTPFTCTGSKSVAAVAVRSAPGASAHGLPTPASAASRHEPARSPRSRASARSAAGRLPGRGRLRRSVIIEDPGSAEVATVLFMAPVHVPVTYAQSDAGGRMTESSARLAISQQCMEVPVCQSSRGAARAAGEPD
jgi:hypothetical protein